MISFGVAKFKSLLLAGSVGVAVNFAMDLVNSMVAGHLDGPDGLAAVNLAAPVISIAGFLAGLVSTGVATNYSFEMGRLERLHARWYFTQGVWMSLIFGGAFSLAIAFGGGAFVDYLGPSEAVASRALGYLVWATPLPVTYCLEMLLLLIVCADGDSRFCSLAYVTSLGVDIVVSVAATRWFGLGAAGCALGMLASQVAGIAILSIHFFRPSNTVAFARHFSWGDTWRISVASFGDAASFVCEAALFLVINKFVISRFGPELLPVAAVIITLWGALELYNGIAIALQPIVSVYHGEGNMPAIRTVMLSALKVSLAEGAALTFVLLAFPGTVVRLVGGLEDPALVALAVPAVRALALAFTAQAVAGLFNSYYMFINHPVLASAVTFASYLVMPTVGIVVGSAFGFTGTWLGLGLSPFVALGAIALWIRLRYRRGKFPLLLPCARARRIHVYGLRLNEDEIVAVSQAITRLPGVPMRAALMVEEVFMTVRDRAGAKPLLGEVTVDLNGGVKLTLRDDGEIFDITDTDGNISSLRSFVVASVMESQRSRFNLVTTGFNRNVFRF